MKLILLTVLAALVLTTGWLTVLQPAAATEDYEPGQELIDDIRSYARETQHGYVHVLRWMRTLQTFGALEPMTLAEAQGYADTFTATRWNPVVQELRKLENAQGEPDQQVIADVRSYAQETHYGSDHVVRWMRTLTALGALEDMSADEAQGYADLGWQRWVPVAAALAALEAAAAPNLAPLVNEQAERYADFSRTGNAPRGVLVSKPFDGIFSDPDGDQLTYSVSLPADRMQLTDTLLINERNQRVFFRADAEADWKALTPPLPEHPVATVTLTATDPGGLSASISGDFLIWWKSYPELLSATADEQTITLTFDLELQADPAPAPAQFTLNAVDEDGSTETIAVTGVSVEGNVMTLQLASAPAAGQSLSLDYAYNYPDDTPLERAGGGQAAPGFHGQAVALSTSEPPGQPSWWHVSGGALDLGQGIARYFFASWLAVDRASSYKLTWRRPDEDFQSGYEFVTTDLGAAFTAPGDGRWVVQLQGCNEAGCGPGIDEIVDIALSQARAPRMASGLSVSGDAGALSLNASWNTVKHATSYNLRWWREHDSGIQAANAVTVAALTSAFTVAEFGQWVVQVEACNAVGCGPTASLPITVSADAAPRIPAITPVCERTPLVRDLLAKEVGKQCAEITGADLAEVDDIIHTPDLDGLTSLKSGDFDGLYNLTELRLDDHNLATLPDDIFKRLYSLQELDLSVWYGFFGSSSRLAALPEKVFNGLTNLKELDLSGHPQLRTLPEDVFEGLSSLQTLNLEGNRMAALPDGVFEGLSNLQSLKLNENRLTALPENVFEGLSNLQSLELNENRLTALPENVFDGLSSLQSLDLSSNSLSTLHEDVFEGLSGLQSLNLRSNYDVTELPESVFDGLSSLQSLNLSTNDLITLHVDVFDGLSSLHTLDLSDNSRLCELPAGSFDGLPNLAVLSIEGTCLPPLIVTWINDKSNVRTLNLSNSRLTELPEDAFEGYINLQTLDLSRNHLTTLPESIFDGLANLKALDLNDNRLSTLPADVFDGLSNLQTLNLGWNGGFTYWGTDRAVYLEGLSELPQDVFDGLANLQELDLSGNNLSELPDGVFGDLSSLQKLDLRNSGPLTGLSGGTFSGLSSLVELDLSDSDLTSLSAGTFSGLSSLRKLRLSENDLTTLSQGTFSGLSSLYSLDLTQNSLSTLSPGAFSGLSGLWELRLSENDLTTLSQGTFSGLSGLQWLDLTENRLTELSDGAFDGLSSLYLLDLTENSLTTLSQGSFSGLSGLKSLRLSENDFAALPEDAFDGMELLRFLRLDQNSLNALPADVFDGLSKLERLLINSNALTTLPEDLFDGLTSLDRLDLRGNQLGSLSEDMFNSLPKLRELALLDNPGYPFGLNLRLAIEIVDQLRIIY